MEQARQILGDIIKRSKIVDISDFHVSQSFVRLDTNQGVEILKEHGRLKGSTVKDILLLLYSSQNAEDLKHLHTSDIEGTITKTRKYLDGLLEKNRVIDFSCQGGDMNSDYLPEGRLRVQAYLSSNGIGLTARILKENIPSLSKLGFHSDHVEKLKEAVNKRSGLVIVTGATGNGKSTTLAGLIDWVRKEKPKHIVTIEDPIEYHYTDHVEGKPSIPSKGFVTQQEVGKHVQDFKQGLKDALRKHPNIILMGEIRDAVDMETCMHAAQTGHLVLTTLHTRSAARTLDRIVELFPGEKADAMLSMLSDCLVMILSQGLLPSTDNSKKELCYEILDCDSVESRSAIKGYRKNDVAIKDHLKQNSNVEWDKSLEQLYERGVITAETYNASKMQTSDNE